MSRKTNRSYHRLRPEKRRIKNLVLEGLNQNRDSDFENHDIDSKIKIMQNSGSIKMKTSSHQFLVIRTTLEGLGEKIN